ncbi:MAG: hypothetical protein A3F10_01030 [Coxiella sp. RIFCSPHIGHO2_12_FULL_42_15]|nr:MAG: hypothetical protein A3F10_01030 [Coxiella sp. RIFCSPHIGHO2_12_FULL_42_15]
MNYDVIIIGAGIVGLATAYQLLNRDPTLKVGVLEKENKPAFHQTGRNSGVIHAGVYYKPGSLKAKFCLEGCRAIKDFCQQHLISYQAIGKIIAAVKPQELSWMADLADRCRQNGLTVEMLTREEARQLQPGLECLSAFFVKETGIVDYQQICHKYAELFQEMGGHIVYGESVVLIRETAQSVMVKTKNQSTYQAKFLITCAGLHSDRLVKLSGLKPDFKIIPFRGEYYKLSPRYNHYFRHTIYPVPNPKLPFLGVHFTPQMAGFTTVGPNAVLALAREGYRWRDVNLKDCIESVTFMPMWKMLARHLGPTWHEIFGSVSKNFYLKQIKEFFPQIEKSDLQSHPAGVRAQAVDRQGNLVNDFLFMRTEGVLHTCNAPSPAATSSLPIGRHIVDLLLNVPSEVQ